MTSVFPSDAAGVAFWLSETLESDGFPTAEVRRRVGLRMTGSFQEIARLA